MAQEPEDIFDAFYYHAGCGDVPYQRNETWLGVFEGIANRIIQDINPHTVLDAGCALGFLVEELRKHSVEAFGVDISEYAIRNVHPSISSYCRVGSIVDPFPQKYDLIVSIEVLEHLPKAEAEKAVANLCQYTDQVLFSSGAYDYAEVTHFNLQPPEYWAALFAKNGFFRDVDFDGSFITPWTVLFRRMDAPFHRVIMGYERRFDRLIQENAAVRKVNLEQRQDIASLKTTIAQKETEINDLKSQIGGLKNSKVFRIASKLRAFLPR